MNKTLSLQQIFAQKITLVTGDSYIDDGEVRTVGKPLTEEAANTPSFDDDSLFVSEFVYRQNLLSMSPGVSGRRELPCAADTPVMVKWPNGMVDVQTAGNVDWRAAFQWKPYIKGLLEINVDDIETKDEEEKESQVLQGAINYWRGVIEIYKFEPEAFATLLAKTMTACK